MNVYPNWLRPADALQYYQRTLEALRLLPGLADSLVNNPGPFLGIAFDRMRDVVAGMIEELKLECMMTLTASIEATFQIDLRARARRKLDDHVSTALRRHLKRIEARQSRVEIEDILDLWKFEVGGVSNAIGNLKQVIEFRHWLAHGRYWQQKSGLTRPDPLDVWTRWQVVREGIVKNCPFPLE